MFRDVQHILPFMVQIWLFATPVAYSSSLIPETAQIMYSINPMAGVVEGFRWAILGNDMISWPHFGLSVAVMSIILVTGLFYFRRVERIFADLVLLN